MIAPTFGIRFNRIRIKFQFKIDMIFPSIHSLLQRLSMNAHNAKKRLQQISFFCCLVLIFLFGSFVQAQTMETGIDNAMVICEDGEVWIAGRGDLGQLGHGAFLWRRPTFDPVINLDSVIRTSVLWDNTCYALRANGALWAWGKNAALYQSIDTTLNAYYSAPAPVHDLTDVSDVDAGSSSYTLVIRSDSTVWSWGRNHKDQLGYETAPATFNGVPAQVPGLSGIVEIEAGIESSFALTDDGHLWSWGSNEYGQLSAPGLPALTRDTAELVTTIDSIVQISASSYHVLALREDSTVWGWGSPIAGGLGDTTGTILFPIQIPGLSQIIQIQTGESVSYALRADGTVWAWGWNGLGQLGRNDTALFSSPIPAQVLYLNNIIEISATWHCCFAKRADGAIFSWGDNSRGELGIGNTINQFAPVMVPPLCYEAATLAGQVYEDLNGNCLFDSGEVVLPYALVSAGNSYTYHGITDTAGEYTIQMDTGTYQVSVNLPTVWGPGTCVPDTQTVTLPIPDTTIFVNFPVTADYLCPVLAVEVSFSHLIRCISGGMQVDYSNMGTIPSDSTYIEIEIDTFITPLSSTLPWVLPQIGNLYVFEIGTLAPGESGSFYIDLDVECMLPLGSTQCVEAHIYPDTSCLPQAPAWDESSIEVEVNCLLHDSVEFKIRNVGSGNMLAPGGFVITEDNILRINGSFTLNSLDEWRHTEAANGSTWSISADQSPGHPGTSYPTAWAEGCGLDPSGEYSMGFVMSYAPDDANPFVDIDCEEITGSYDPNDKSVTPGGICADHYILQEDDLEYKIRFQNTGTATAFRVEVRDTLSAALDVSTFRNFTSSHDGVVSIEDGNILIFTFDNIMLPDSFTNEPESNGWITFKISQVAGTPIGTRIENSAAIYFDFNLPVITNVTFNTVWDTRYCQILLLNQDQASKADRFTVYPNPFNTSTIIEFENASDEEVNLQVFTLNGQLTREESHKNASHIEFQKGDLVPGMYLIRMTTSSGMNSSGKVIVY